MKSLNGHRKDLRVMWSKVATGVSVGLVPDMTSPITVDNTTWIDLETFKHFW